MATTTRSELRRLRSEYWGFFGLVLPFWYRGYVLGFFFFFFDKHSIAFGLFCFCSVNCNLYRLSQYIRDWFSLYSLQRCDRGYDG